MCVLIHFSILIPTVYGVFPRMGSSFWGFGIRIFLEGWGLGRYNNKSAMVWNNIHVYIYYIYVCMYVYNHWCVCFSVHPLFLFFFPPHTKMFVVFSVCVCRDLSSSTFNSMYCPLVCFHFSPRKRPTSIFRLLLFRVLVFWICVIGFAGFIQEFKSHSNRCEKLAKWNTYRVTGARKMWEGAKINVWLMFGSYGKSIANNIRMV